MNIHRHPALSRHPEQQYLDILRTLLHTPPRDTRNDDATRSIFGARMEFDLAHGFPLLTTKKVFWRGVVAELIWFLSGSTNAKVLEDQGIEIWRRWGNPETREMGPIYGKQMRRWWVDVEQDSSDDILIDQIANMLQGLRDDPHGRRHVMTLWNPADLKYMALPPCHGVAIQFYVENDGRLSLFMHQRSADTFLGVPFNIASYSLLLTMFAAVLERQPGRFIWSGGDVHLYGNHVEQAEQQVLRDPRPFPTIAVSGQHRDLDNWTMGDITLIDYDPWPKLPADVSA
jgi:thymidylate synthase